MHFSSLVHHIAGEAVDAWQIHSAALAAEQRGEDVIILSVGDPDFSTPDNITEAAVKAIAMAIRTTPPFPVAMLCARR